MCVYCIPNICFEAPCGSCGKKVRLDKWPHSDEEPVLVATFGIDTRMSDDFLFGWMPLIHEVLVFCSNCLKGANFGIEAAMKIGFGRTYHSGRKPGSVFVNFSKGCFITVSFFHPEGVKEYQHQVNTKQFSKFLNSLPAYIFQAVVHPKGAAGS